MESTGMRFRFTIRDLLLLAVVVALAVGWWLERTQFSTERVDLNQQLKASDQQLNKALRQVENMEYSQFRYRQNEAEKARDFSTPVPAR